MVFQKNEFKAELARRGLTQRNIAGFLGIDPVSLYRKMTGESDFYRNEIEIIRQKLSLSNRDIMRIFFA